MAVFAHVSSIADPAQALAATPLFAGLSAVDLARLVPELEELEFAAGDTVFRQGAPSDGLYLIRQGSVGVSVGKGEQQRVMAVLEAPAYFGEMALLSDAPRSATIRALRAVRLWRLPRDRFDLLIERQPVILRHAAAEVTQRLNDTTRRLSLSQDGLTAIAGLAFDALDEPAQRIVQIAAVAGEVDAAQLAAIQGEAYSTTSFHWLMRESGFFQPGPGDRVQLVDDGLRPVVVARLEAQLGHDGRRIFERRVLTVLLASPNAEPRHIARLAHEIEDWDSLIIVLARCRDELLETVPDDVEFWLRALPSERLWTDRSLVKLLFDACRAQHRDNQATDVEREAARHGLILPEPFHADDPMLPAAAPESRSIRVHLQQLGLRALGRASTAQVGEESPSRVLMRRVLAISLGLLVVALALGPPPAGLSPAGYRVLLGVVLTLAYGLLDVLPDYLLVILLVVVWAATGTVPLNVGASGLSSPAWFLLVGAFGAGVAVTQSGMLFRVAVEMTRRLPPNHAVRCLSLAVLGLLFTAGMPSTAGRLALASPLAQDIADTLRLPHRGPGAAGLALSVFVGFGQMGTLFLTGSSATLVAYGLLPADVQAKFSWGTWLLAALPAHIVLFALTMTFILVRFRSLGHEADSQETLRLQRSILGAPTHDEIAVLVIMSALLVGFVTEPLHGLNPAWLALAALGALFLTGTVRDASLRSGVNWGLLLYLGIVLGFGNVFSTVGLDTWLAGRLDGLTVLIGDSQTLFLLVIGLVAMLAGVVLRAGPSSAVLCLVLFPLGTSLGVSPWVVALTVLMTTNLWLHPQQSVYYLVAYYGAGERGFSHGQARPLAFAYAVFVLIAIAASIPYWRWLGLMT